MHVFHWFLWSSQRVSKIFPDPVGPENQNQSLRKFAKIVDNFRQAPVINAREIKGIRPEYSVTVPRWKNTVARKRDTLVDCSRNLHTKIHRDVSFVFRKVLLWWVYRCVWRKSCAWIGINLPSIRKSARPHGFRWRSDAFCETINFNRSFRCNRVPLMFATIILILIENRDTEEREVVLSTILSQFSILVLLLQ